MFRRLSRVSVRYGYVPRSNFAKRTVSLELHDRVYCLVSKLAREGEYVRVDLEQRESKCRSVKNMHKCKPTNMVM